MPQLAHVSAGCQSLVENIGKIWQEFDWTEIDTST
jgi:hypothetical protein